MNILLLGSGGREHALAWKMHQSSLCSQLYIAPGNAGTSQYGTNVDLPISKDFQVMESFCRTHSIQMIVVGPEDPLVQGVYDYFEAAHLRESFGPSWLGVIGPSGEAAQLEGSKAYAKLFMQRHNIPTASYKEFSSENYDAGYEYIRNHTLPVVLKADGLAAGKGVIIATDREEALREYELMLRQSKFGAAGNKVVVEEFLSGIELSVFVLTDGAHYLLLPEAKDYKRIGEGDTGLNTGGMGAISPVPFANGDFMKKVEERIIKPTIEGLRKEQLTYKGFVFFGLIKVGDDPYVIEYNCRMGDPETEVVIPRLKSDLVSLFVSTSKQQLNQVVLEQDQRSAVTIVAVSGGYPGDYKKGLEITGLETSENNTILFHAGTKSTEGKIVTNGGRVLAVTTLSNSLSSAVKQSRKLLEQVQFDGMYYRKDIGYEFPES
ncbi:MAG: phosphoribosylamine--glycine ligase [Lacibacter sp.]